MMRRAVSALLATFRARRFCVTCGDEFVEALYQQGFDPRTGEPVTRTWRKCPRNDDYYPDYWDMRQQGRCHPPYPFACANQKTAHDAQTPYCDCEDCAPFGVCMRVAGRLGRGAGSS